MPKNQDSLNTELARFLKRFKPVMRDSSAEKVPVPSEAEVFQFKLVVDGEDYGTVTCSIDGLHKLVIYYNDSVLDSPKTSKNDDITWEKFIVMMKDFAKSKQLSFELKDQDELEPDMAKRDHMKRLNEGYRAVGRKQSINDNLPECKIIIKHSKVMEEGEQRFRHVEKIFIENSQGERFLAPTTRPGLARVYARHIAEGGRPFDERWTHINTIIEDYTKMAGFVRATKNNQFNESAQQLVNEGVQHYLGLRESLHDLTTHRGYNTYFQSWTPPLMEDEASTDISEMFKVSNLDPRIESALPILNKLNKNLLQTNLQEVDHLENWADNIIEQSLVPKTEGQIDKLEKVLSKQPFALGPDGAFAKNALDNILHDDELFGKLEQAGKDDPNGDATEIVVDWLAQQNNPEYQTLLDKLETSVDSKEMAEGKGLSASMRMALALQKEKQKREREQELRKPFVDKLLKKPEDKKDNDTDKKVGEDLDSNQKRVGQLGPTEKVKPTGPILGAEPKSQTTLRNKFFGASESVDPLIRIKNLSGLQK